MRASSGIASDFVAAVRDIRIALYTTLAAVSVAAVAVFMTWRWLCQ